MRRIALCLILLLATTLPAAAQTPKLRVIPGPKPGGGEVNITVDPGGVVEAQ